MPIRPENLARYPADWKVRRRFILLRARNCCEWCKAANGQPHPVTGSRVVLTTAHVWDHRPENASLLNLAALCQKCHLAHDAKHHAQTARQTRRAKRAIADLWDESSMTRARDSDPRGTMAGQGAPKLLY